MATKNNFSDNFNEVMDYLPLISKSNSEIFKTLTDKNLSVGKLSEIINKDHSLSAKVLALANSPVYGFSKKISTIEMAISILGFETVKDLIIGFSIINSTLEDKDRYFNVDAFNRHSYICGYISQLIANDFEYPVRNEAFVAGLLHDIGIAIIHHYMNNEFTLISELKFYRKLNQSKAEKLILGKTHSEIGAEVASKWFFPEALIDAIRFHHSPSQANSNKKLVAIIHLADFIASNEAPQYLLSSENEPLDKSVIDILNIPDESYLFDLINNVSNLIRSINLI